MPILSSGNSIMRNTTSSGSAHTGGGGLIWFLCHSRGFYPLLSLSLPWGLILIVKSTRSRTSQETGLSLSLWGICGLCSLRWGDPSWRWLALSHGLRSQSEWKESRKTSICISLLPDYKNSQSQWDQLPQALDALRSPPWQIAPPNREPLQTLPC